MMIAPKRYGKIQQPVHYFTRFQDGGTITGLNTTSTTFGTIYFELANVPGYAEYTAMYDFYKINAVQVRFIPTVDNSLSTGVPTKFDSRLITVIDYNDRTTPTSLNDLRQYSNCKVTPNNRVHKRFLHPKPTIAIDEDSVHSNSYGLGQTGRTPWISTVSNQCEWYGIKFGIDHGAFGADYELYKVEYKLYLAFKGRN